jgi:hypothetical protein
LSDYKILHVNSTYAQVKWRPKTTDFTNKNSDRLYNIALKFDFLPKWYNKQLRSCWQHYSLQTLCTSQLCSCPVKV